MFDVYLIKCKVRYLKTVYYFVSMPCRQDNCDIHSLNKSDFYKQRAADYLPGIPLSKKKPENIEFINVQIIEKINK